MLHANGGSEMLRLVSNYQTLLVIEDDVDDYRLIESAFRKYGVENDIVHKSSGADAMDYLFGGGTHKKPGFIFLDLNLGDMSGIDILIKIKESDTLRDVPVVIFTTSHNPDDVKACYWAGANAYVRKGDNLDDFHAAIKALTGFWFEVALVNGSAEAKP